MKELNATEIKPYRVTQEDLQRTKMVEVCRRQRYEIVFKVENDTVEISE